MKPSRWIGLIVVLILVLAVVHYFLTAKANIPYRDSNATSTAAAQSDAPVTTPPTTSDTGASNSAVAANTTTNTNPAPASPAKNFMHTITIKTSKGTIVFETYDADAPKTVQNFITLASKGFYDGLIFHRVIEGFMIQGGDPTGTGRGGPGYQFADELNPVTDSYKAGYVRGTVAMANAGPDTNGSQFFIMHKDTPLPHNYTIFGRVVSGMDVVDAIAAVKVDSNDKPLQNVTMEKVTAASK